MKSMMKKNIFLTAIFVFILIILTAVFAILFSGDRKTREKNSFADTDNIYLSRAEKIADLKLDSGKTIRLNDTKGGFFGEGKVLLEIQYSQKAYKDIKNEISTQKHWEKLPMKKELTEHLLGYDLEFPQNGYYLFYDRHSEADSHYDYNEMAKRSSMNFSVLILDNDTQEIIYIEKDT